VNQVSNSIVIQHTVCVFVCMCACSYIFYQSGLGRAVAFLLHQMYLSKYNVTKTNEMP